ncbi:dolichyl-phosphate-mannose-protein mannosyltransferase [Catenulispora sp. GP43]|uniref:dolichyl-phosphate-mannose--protein mannosyltransferase n=1 Tax=Catenulispora sp. GP43 TaxID=3156263 RepID=UPI00351406A5
MTSLAPTRSSLPDDDSEEDYGGRRRGRSGSHRERGRVWWRPNLTPRDDEQGELTLRERLVPSFAREPWWVSWGFPVLIMLVGGFMRFWHLGLPKWVIFDETYYAKDAWATIHFGHEIGWHDDGPGIGMANDDKAIIANPHIWRTLIANHQGNAVHPPVGKWMIGAGEWLFGFTPFGWRFIPAVCGTLAILMTARIARRMFRSTLIGCLAGLLLASDGLEFVMSRTALLDIFVMFWTLAAFGCFVIDRDKMRTRLVDWRETYPDTPLPDDVKAPPLGWRPWRVAGAVCLGLDLGTKWSGLWIIPCFIVLSLLWDHAALRAVGIRRHWAGFFRRDTWQTALLGLLVLATYTATWTGWFVTKDGNYRQWAAQNNAIHFPVLSALRSWWEYHWQTYHFHVNLDSPHAYMSNPWSWLVMGRPTDYYYCSKGATGCPPLAADQHQQVLALGTPPLWWFATLALVWCCWRWIARRDWRAGSILCGMLAAWAFWLNYQHRTIFTFYAVAFVPFMCIAAAYLLGVIVGRADALQYRRVWGAVVAGAITVYILVMFIYFYPILSAQTITYNQWLDRMWWPSWI